MQILIRFYKTYIQLLEVAKERFLNGFIISSCTQQLLQFEQ